MNTCAPCSMRMYWDEEFSSHQLLHVRSKMNEEPLELLAFWKKRLAWQESAQVNEDRIFIPDPMPIYMLAEEKFFGFLTER